VSHISRPIINEPGYHSPAQSGVRDEYPQQVRNSAGINPPRPQATRPRFQAPQTIKGPTTLMRQERSLAGEWQFQIDPEGQHSVIDLAPDRVISVPLPWQAAFPELEPYSGYAWYRRTFGLTPQWLSSELLLTFGAVDYWCQVFINGQLAGEHEGGYTAFTLPIRAFAKPGENEIAVRVYDSAQQGITIPRWPDAERHAVATKPPFEAENVPHGKQEWYLNVGGIWQDVTLTAVAATWIDQVRVTPDIATGRVDVEVQLGGATMSGGELRAQVAGIDAAQGIVANQMRYTLSLTVPDVALWTPETPNLYTLELTLDGECDSRRVRFGFRKIETRNGHLLLNGEPIYLLCALDQDLYPDTIYTVPSREYIRDQFEKAKVLGLNSLRCHIKPPDPVYLELADEMGLLIWAEIPSWRTFVVRPTLDPEHLSLPPTIQARAERTLEEMIARDYNHPSLIIWTIVNEDWGTSLPLSADDRAWVSRMYDRCKQLDPTRLVVDNSPCPHSWGPNIHVKSDLDDFHVYANIPDQAEHWVQMIDQFDLHPLWTYSAYGDAQRTGTEPMILSEFGNWGLPSLNSIGGLREKEPHWFGLGPWWSAWEGEPGWPRGVVKRLEQLGLTAIWPTYQDYATATQWQQWRAMRFEIEVMRRQPNIAGYVITEFTDAYWESNGLLDFYRQPKAYHDQFATINAPDVIVPEVEQYMVWDDQPVRARLYGSHYSGADWHGARLHWAVEGGADGEQPIPETARGSVTKFGVQAWRLPKVAHAQRVEIQLAIDSAEGAELAYNTIEVLALPAFWRQALYTEPVAVLLHSQMSSFTDELTQDAPESAHTETPGESKSAGVSDMSATSEAAKINFAKVLAARGYNTTKNRDAGILITDYPDADMLRRVAAGGSMLYLSSGPGPFFWRQGRSGTYGGAWLASFTWLRPGIHKRLDVASPLSLPFAEIMPLGTLLGLPVEDPTVQADFLAGQISGWINHPAVHTVQFRYGKGRVLMTTFRLKEVLILDPTHPAAVAMLHDLVDHLASDACNPTLTTNFTPLVQNEVLLSH